MGILKCMTLMVGEWFPKEALFRIGLGITYQRRAALAQKHHQA